MPICYRTARRMNRCGRIDAAAVRDRQSRLAAPDTIAEELYDVPGNQVPTLRCCDFYNGCREIDARRRSHYWPSFAHPRWLTCAELNNRNPYRCYRRQY